MEPISALVTIIAAGAASALRETASQAVKDAYAGVKAILAHQLKSYAGLEAAPRDEDKKKAVADELKNSAANDDSNLLEQIKTLEAALRADPQGSLQKSGVSIEDLNAANDILIKDVKYGQYFKVHRVISRTGKIEITGVSGGTDPEKKS